MDALLPYARVLCRRFGSNIHPWTIKLSLLILALAIVSACSQQGGGPPPALTARKATSPTIISQGDVIRLTFRKLQELNQTQKVRPDGWINLLQVGRVKAAGKSLDALQSELVARYELKEAGDLIVSMESTDSVVYVTGAVGTVGRIVLDRPMTVLEAIMESGGFDRATANLKRVTLTRMVNGKYVTYTMDMRNPNAGAMYVQPYDMIEVPRFFH
jgi:polysaccharide export outer membrane protein